MTSPTGINRNPPTFSLKSKHGLTFVEVMVSLTIISVGLVGILKTYLISMDRMRHLTTRIYASTFIDHRMTEIERLMRTDRVLPIEPRKIESFVIHHKKIEFLQETKIKPVGEFIDLFQLDLTLSWSEDNRKISLSRTAYISDIGLLRP